MNFAHMIESSLFPAEVLSRVSETFKPAVDRGGAVDRRRKIEPGIAAIYRPRTDDYRYEVHAKKPDNTNVLVYSGDDLEAARTALKAYRAAHPDRRCRKKEPLNE